MFFPTPFLMDLVRKRGFWETHFSKLRPCVRPSVQTPTDLESVDFASPKMTLPPVKTFCFFVEFATVVFLLLLASVFLLFIRFTSKNYANLAILRQTSEGLVFRPYTQIWRTNCTRVSLRASTRVSPNFAKPTHNSPRFPGPNRYARTQISLRRSKSVVSAKRYQLSLPFCIWVSRPHAFTPTCAEVRFLGACFTTGRIEPFSQYRGMESTTHFPCS